MTKLDIQNRIFRLGQIEVNIDYLIYDLFPGYFYTDRKLLMSDSDLCILNDLESRRSYFSEMKKQYVVRLEGGIYD